MKLEKLIELCREWNGLGWSVQEQAEGVILHAEDLEEQNSNALRMVADFLKSAERAGITDAEEYRGEIDRYLGCPKCHA